MEKCWMFKLNMKIFRAVSGMRKKLRLWERVSNKPMGAIIYELALSEYLCSVWKSRVLDNLKDLFAKHIY